MELYTFAEILSITYTLIMNKDEEFLLKFAHVVRYARKKKGLSQEELAALMNVNVKTISKLELGDANLTLINLYHLGEALELDFGVLNTFKL